MSHSVPHHLLHRSVKHFDGHALQKAMQENSFLDHLFVGPPGLKDEVRDLLGG
jgi:hypothetical protein